MQRDTAQALLQVVNFKSRSLNGSIDINSLIKVIALPYIQAIPESVDYVIGIINLAGKVIPVIDLMLLLKIGQPDRYTISTPILICQNQHRHSFGLIVESVQDISVIDKNMIERNSEQDNKGVLSGTIKYDHSLSLLLDVDALYQHANLTSLANIGKSQ